MKKNTILGIIPARAGSKGIRRKNIKNIHGKPLIQWTIDEAKKVKQINKIIVSTDDLKIAKLSNKLGIEIPFMRPKKYAGDNSLSLDVVLHVLSLFQDFKYILLLQPTSPMRNEKDIRGIINFTIKNNIKSAVSVTRVREYPQLIYGMDKMKKLKKEFNSYNQHSLRQKYKKLHRVNGALYMAETKWFLKNRNFINQETHGYEMPIERSIDIDDEYDWTVANFLLKNK